MINKRQTLPIIHLRKPIVTFFDKPSISKDIFLIYLVYQIMYLVYQISEIDILSISKFKH